MIDEFLQHLRSKGLATKTVYRYKLFLSHYTKYLQADITTATKKKIESYYISLVENEYSSGTYYAMSHAVYSLYNWLASEDLILINPAPKPLSSKNNQLPRAVPTMREVKQAHTILNESENPVYFRDSVIFDLGYSCGLRRAELSKLNISDIDMCNRTVFVRGKGRKKRLVPIGKKCLKQLLDYMINYRPRLQKEQHSKALFLSVNSGLRLSPSGIDARFTVIRKRYNVSEKLTPHALRHAFARDLLTAGASIVDVSKMLGHAKISTTQIYTRLVAKDLKKAHRQYHPRG